jgi:hypothetical protein
MGEIMKLHKVSQYGILLSCGFVLAGEARADNCSGYDVLVSQSAETTDLGKGQTLTVVRNHSMIVTDDPKARDNLSVGECNGTFLSLPNGQSKGSGFCERRDKDGDTYSLEWAIAPGAEKGTWKGLTGTGKFARESANSGWWQNAAADGKVFATKWGGTCNW